MSKKELENNNCPKTSIIELKFLQDNELIAYKNNEDSLSSSILYSRTAKTSYIWPNGKTLSAKDLRIFEETGHTLGLDYTRIYCRKFALDLDCLCRKILTTTTHLNDGLANKILQTTIQTLKNVLDVVEPICVLWKNKCGYHLYSNVNVSLPTHLYLAKIISANFTDDDVIFETPSIMPLPYSAKISGQPYMPQYPTQQSLELVVNCDNDFYHEMFEYTKLYMNDTIAEMSTMIGTLYLNPSITTKQKCGIPKITKITSIKIYEKFKYMSQFEEYMANSAVVDDWRTGGTIDYSKITDKTICTKIQEFFSKLNKKFNNEASIEGDTFVNASLVNNGGLYLQPYVIMLHKFLQPITIETFKLVLEAIYIDHLKNDKCIIRFLKFYSIVTYQCYTDDWECMLDHLAFLYTNNVSPYESLHNQIDALLCINTNERSSTNYLKTISAADKDTRRHLITTVVELYVNILIELQVIMYNTTTSNYYILEDGTYYKMTKRLLKDSIPPVIYNWIGQSKACIDMINFQLDVYRSKFTIGQAALWSVCNFQFSTLVGVFNSVTGMYTAKTRFLRFYKMRDFAIWELDRVYQMYEKQNYDIIDKLSMGKKYAKILHENITSLFVHFLFAPAMIQLKYIMSIEEDKISKLINMLAVHKDLTMAYFLLEYFPINPKFIFLIMYIYKKYDGIGSLETYAKLSDHIFNYHKVDIEAWKKKFEGVLMTVTYEEKESQMETLMTLKGKNVENVSQEFCFYATIIAVCIIKCPTYEKFVQAFDVEIIPPSRKTKLEYDDYNFATTVGAFKSNMLRAMKILYGDDLSRDEQNLVTTMFSIGMSSCFDPETTTELLASVSALFVPFNKNKKFFLYYGTGGVGKSVMCNIIQHMASPKVCRFNNLQKAMERANVTTRNNVTILNEVACVDSEDIKAITGNDAESAQQFFSQEYEIQKDQSLIYGATNSLISFTTKRGRQTDVDAVTVKRFHAIRLTGQHNNADFKSSCLFDMLTSSELYGGIIESSDYELANGMSWLSYASYVLRRDENLYPSINESYFYSKQYRENVYYNNNRLYAFLVNIGITEERGFSMSSETLLNIVKCHLDKRNVLRISNINEFMSIFEKQYGIKLENATTVPNLQQLGLVEHIFNNMAVCESIGATITKDDLRERVKMYSSEIDQGNARLYFLRLNGASYDYKSGVYNNLAFKLESMKYDGNEMKPLYNTPNNDFSVDENV